MNLEIVNAVDEFEVIASSPVINNPLLVSKLTSNGIVFFKQLMNLTIDELKELQGINGISSRQIESFLRDVGVNFLPDNERLKTGLHILGSKGAAISVKCMLYSIEDIIMTNFDRSFIKLEFRLELGLIITEAFRFGHPNTIAILEEIMNCPFMRKYKSIIEL